MNIYYLFQDKCTGYDTYDSCVVMAESEEEAKSFHPDGGKLMPENEWYQSSWPSDPSDISCKLIGKAAKGIEKGVICASFNAG